MGRVWYTADGNTWNGPYREGQWIAPSSPLPDGRSNLRITHDPSNRLYLAIEDSTEPGEYQDWGDPQWNVTLQGTLGDAAARAAETSQIRSIPLLDLYKAKIGELDEHEGAVLTANAQSSLLGNWVIVINDNQTLWISRVDDFLTQRLQDQVEELRDYLQQPQPRADFVPSTPDYWARDVPLVAISKATDRRVRENFDESQWKTTIKDIGLHSFDATDASALVRSDIDAAYGDGTGAPGGPEWQALASIDVREASYGWPPVYVPETEPLGAD